MKLLFILIFATINASAAMHADVVINWNGITRGLIGAADGSGPTEGQWSVLNPGTVGNYQYWQILNGVEPTPATPARSFIVAAPASYTLPVPFEINGTNYALGSGTNWLMQLSDTNINSEKVKIVLNGATNFLATYYYFPQETNTTGSLRNRDTFYFGGTFGIVQLQYKADNTTVTALAHSAINGGTNSQSGAQTEITRKPYLVLAHFAGSEGVCRVVFLDPANSYSTAVYSQSAIDVGDATGNVYWWIGYIGNLQGQHYIGDAAFSFGVSGAQFTNFIADIQGSITHRTARVGRANVGRIVH